MRFFLASLIKDLRRMRRDPGGLLLSAAIPVVLAVLIRLAFGGGDGTTPTATLLVADHDGSPFSALFLGAMTQGPVGDLIAMEKAEETDALARLERGRASAVLVIPQGFGSAVTANRPVALQLVENPAETILPRIVEETLSLLVDATFYLQHILGRPLQTLAAGPPPGAGGFSRKTMTETGVAINEAVTRIAPYLFPPIVDLETVEADGPPALNLGRLFLTGILVMGLLFIAQSQSNDLWQELEGGTLRRTLIAPGRLRLFLAGKLASTALFMLAISLAGLLAARVLMGIEVENIAMGGLWLTGTGVMLLLLLMLLQLHASTARGGAVMATLIIFPLAMLGGSFFPFEAMPEAMAAVGRFTPNGWALEVLKGILRGDLLPGDLLRAWGILGLVLLLLFAWTLRRLGGGFGRS